MRIAEYSYPLLGYTLGSIPFGLVLSNLFGNKKLQESGSKNIGATNVCRTQGKLMGFATFLFDFLKGFLPCFFLQIGSETANLLMLAAPVVGHMFSVWLKFSGGKGVATYLGVLCAASAFAGAWTLTTWLCLFYFTRISAVASIIAIIFSLFIFYWEGTALCLDFLNQLYVLMGLVVLVIVKHHENLRRLMENMRGP
jgi:glycerol-3-phosphate acyltransferase PlsY